MSISSNGRVISPGADILLSGLDPDCWDKPVSCLTKEEWVQLADAFHDWPFKPDVMEDEGYFGVEEDRFDSEFFSYDRYNQFLEEEDEAITDDTEHESARI